MGPLRSEIGVGVDIGNGVEGKFAGAVHSGRIAILKLWIQWMESLD